MNARNKQSDIYNNWQMVAPNGQLLARCSQKRAEWYLSRDLATITSDKVIQLTFTPAGDGNSEVPFLLEEKKNICVVCGTELNLNRHHVVPYQYRKWMPQEDKGHSSYDVLPICLDHHDEYENEAQKYSRNLAIIYDAPFSVGVFLPEEIKAKRMYGLLKVIAELRTVPADRLLDITQQTSEYFSVKVTPTVAAQILEEGLPHFKSAYMKSHGQVIVEKIMAGDKLQEFIVNWRKHFVATMNPQFLSKNWNIFHVHRAI